MTKRLRTLGFSSAFGLTGVGTALLGATLPATLHDWHLSDSRGGLLLFASWGGSTAGAFFARGTSGISAIVGLALAAFELFWLSLQGTHSPILNFFLYGLGLGMAMTSISLMRAHEVAATDADLELNRLNLVWAVGACFAPALAFHSLRLLTVAQLFRILAAVFFLMVLSLAISLAFGRPAPCPNSSRANATKLPFAPVALCLFAAASVGLESAIGSWLTTYADRARLGLTLAVSANSFFWAGLLISRALHSFPGMRVLHTRIARAAHVVAVGLALLLLTVFPTRWLLPMGGLLCGVGLGPLYPYVLSIALPRYRSTAVFVSAGIGAATIPWLTGTLSSAYGSLRIGLLACCFTFLLLAGTTATMRKNSSAGELANDRPQA